MKTLTQELEEKEEGGGEEEKNGWTKERLEEWEKGVKEIEANSRILDKALREELGKELYRRQC